MLLHALPAVIIYESIARARALGVVLAPLVDGRGSLDGWY